jgi:ABC-type glycerol-3-phosphate transport system permease component
VLVTAISILTTTLISAWAAYGLVRLKIPFGGPVVLLLLGGLMLAPTVALIPLFGLLQQLHIYNTLWALMVLYTAFRIPFTTFLIRAYMIDLPTEVDEAAVLDGSLARPDLLADHPADVSSHLGLGGPASGPLRVERVRLRAGLPQRRRA